MDRVGHARGVGSGVHQVGSRLARRLSFGAPRRLSILEVTTTEGPKQPGDQTPGCSIRVRSPGAPTAFHRGLTPLKSPYRLSLNDPGGSVSAAPPAGSTASSSPRRS